MDASGKPILGLQQIHELQFQTAGAPEKAGPPSPVTVACPIINIATSGSRPSAPLSEQGKIDQVAFAILGGPPGDAQELEDARGAAVDVMRVFAEIDRAAGRAPLEDYEIPYEPPALEQLGDVPADVIAQLRAPSITAYVTSSVMRPGKLSLRASEDDTTWSPLLLALVELLERGGFKPGDAVELSVCHR
jgi:hypothetical protein